MLPDEATGRMPGVPIELKCRCGFVAEKPAAMGKHKKDCPVERLRRVPGGVPVQAPATLGHSELRITNLEPGSAPNAPSAEAQAAAGQEAVGSKALSPGNAAHVAGQGKAGSVPVLGRGRMICPACGDVKASHGACKTCGVPQEPDTDGSIDKRRTYTEDEFQKLTSRSRASMVVGKCEDCHSTFYQHFKRARGRFSFKRCEACKHEGKTVPPASRKEASKPGVTLQRIAELRAMLAAEESKIKNRYKPMACFDATGGNNYSRLG